MGEKDAQLLRTYWMALFTAILLIGGGYFGYVFFTQEEKTLANDLTPLGYLGERIEHDLNSEPLLEVSEDLSIADTLRDGIQIEYPNQNSNLKTQNDNELNQNETTFTTDGVEETLSLNFPKNLSEAMEITLPGGSFTVTHDTNQDYSVDILSQKEASLPSDSLIFNPQSSIEEEQQQTEEKNLYIRYTSADQRKQIYYAYQKDQAEGYRNLKHWTLYNHGIGIESESYTFTSVTLKINDRGEVEGRFLAEQDSMNNTQGVDEDLWVRAQRVIAQDQALNTPPDFIIPPPYYLDQYGRQTTLEWALNNDADTISVAFNPLPGEYPVALDPTLQFTAPGVSNSGDYIDGESGSTFGHSFVIGDFNNDGKEDLVVGANAYNSDQGRVYMFYADEDYTEASGASHIISGSSTLALEFGHTLAAGDLDADGTTDLVVSGPYGSGAVRAGVYIFYNDGAYPTSVDSADEAMEHTSSFDYFGHALAVLDVDDDGDDDLLVTSPNYSAGRGLVHFFYNDGAYPSGSDPSTYDDYTIEGETTTTQFGQSITAGDFDGDGDDDFVVGAPYTEIAGQFLAGRSFVFYNDGAYPLDATGADVTYTGEAIVGGYFGGSIAAGDFDADGVTDIAMTGNDKVYIAKGGSLTSGDATSTDYILSDSGSDVATRVSIGDFNSDGVDDVLSGDFLYDSAEGADAGRIYIHYGSASMASSTLPEADLIITGEVGSQFGFALCGADFNHDGKDDIIVSAPAYNSQGRTYIFYSQSGQVNLETHITGESVGDYFGSAFTTGDWNGDGREDLAVGAWAYNSNQGRVHVFYNDGDYSTLASTSDEVITGESAGDFFGDSLASGDFNNDGTDDLVVGGTTYNSDQGRAYIFYGDGSLPSTAASADVIITGETSNMRFGNALTVGDFNTDGDDDLAVGAYYAPTGTSSVYIFYGDGSIPTTASTADVTITAEDVEDTNNSQFGFSLAAGDLNADGNDDLVVGANFYDASVSTEGRAYIFYGDGSLPTTASTADVKITGEGAVNNFGESLAIGDYNNDGSDDLVIGAKGHNVLAGRVYLFYGDASFPTSAANADSILSGEGSNDYFGWQLATGDFNNDGKDDLAVTAYIDDSYTGRTYLFYNDGTYPSAAADADVLLTGASSNDDYGYALTAIDWNANGKDDLVIGAPGYDNGGDTGRVYLYETREDYAWEIQRQELSDGIRVDPIMGYEMKIAGEGAFNLGSATLIADINNDGRDDLIVADDSFGQGGLWNKGRVYIFYNDGSYPTRASKADVILSGQAANDYFGSSLAAGDYNNDGKTDLVIGVYGYGGANQGRAYLFYSDNIKSQSISNADVIITGQTNDNLGSSLATGDLDRDGKDDLVIGGTRYGSYTGAAYVFYNESIETVTSAGADVAYTGEDVDNYFGNNLVIDDLNSDGTDDLVVGAYGYSSNTGRAYLYYGGTMASGTATSADVIFTGGTHFSLGLTTGDLNNDGDADLIIGAPIYNSYQGRTYVFYGPHTASTTVAGADVTLTGSGSWTRFGNALAVSDFNSDGTDDLVVGAFQESSYAGDVYIFYGGNMVSEGTAGADISLPGAFNGNRFGEALAVGDLNNDGKNDLAIGATGHNTGDYGYLYFYTTNDRHYTGSTTDEFVGSSFAVGDYNNDGQNDLAVGAYGSKGNAYIFYGGAKATTSVTGADIVLAGEASYDIFGREMVTADINHDGTDDLVVTAANYTTDGGRVYIFYGGNLTSKNASAADVIYTSSADSWLGDALAVGDYNNDGQDDLAVGASFFNGDLKGAAFIFYSTSTPGSRNATAADVTLTGEVASSWFGYQLTSADWNNDSVSDLAVGAYAYNTNQGKVYVFYGGSMVSDTATSADVIFTGEASSRFGLALTAGDLNRDGTADLAIGAEQYNSFQGRTYIFYGGSLASTSATNADVIVTGETGGSNYFGSALATGDLNWDGTVDLVVGADNYNSGQGRVYVFYSDELTSTKSAEFANVVISGEGSGHLGFDVGTGDLSGNGVEDLVLSAYVYDDPSITNNDEGRVYVIMSEAAAEQRSHYRVRGNLQIRGNVQFQ